MKKPRGDDGGFGNFFLLGGEDGNSSEDEDYDPSKDEAMEEVEIDPFMLESPFSLGFTSRKRERTPSPLLIAQRTRAKATVDDSILEESVQVVNEAEEFIETTGVYENFLRAVANGDDGKEIDDSDSDLDYQIENEVASEVVPEEFRTDDGVVITTQELSELIRDQVPDSDSADRRPKRSVAQAAVEAAPLLPKFKFSADQLRQLKNQLKDMFQLCAQQYVFALKDGGLGQGSRLHNLLEEMYRHWEVASAFHTLRLRSLRNIGTLPPQLRLAAEAQLQRANARGTGGPLLRHVPGIEHLPAFLQAANTSKSPNDPSVFATYTSISIGFDTQLCPGESAFRPNQKRDRVRGRFTPAEDQLLVVGISRYGMDWGQIRKYVLPTKSATELANRYKNQTATSAEANPIKTFKLSLNDVHLPDHELEVLKDAVAKHGQKWPYISSTFLPHRPPEHLKKAWTNTARKVDTKKSGVLTTKFNPPLAISSVSEQIKFEREEIDVSD